MKSFLTLTCAVMIAQFAFAQPENRWQQRVNYRMLIDMDVATNKFKGKQSVDYTNNSDQTLTKIYYHLYWNAFQPGSNMDARSLDLGSKKVNGRADWDPRVRDRISKLKEDEIGYQKIITLKMNGVLQQFEAKETILEVQLSSPIKPKTTVKLEMDFETQVPQQVRRAGRDNPTTGVRYSMSQWYPKICEYDREGWHPTPYTAREFYGVWGDFDVTINIDQAYKLGGTGVLTNAAEIGWGYDRPGTELKPLTNMKRSWKFTAKNVHDFVWAADPEYVHLVRSTYAGGPTIHVLYNYKENDARNDSNWTAMADAAVTVLPFIEQHFGKYPYAQYSFIQGGDGGMEYPMATLVAGSGLGTAFHEWMHTWYQMILGTNESLYAWMDEGFTEWSSQLVEDYYTKNVRVAKLTAAGNTAGLRYYDSVSRALPLSHSGSYESYYALAKSKIDEPMTTHADHYETNFAYSINAYSKGSVFLEQLGYVIGAPVRDRVMMTYYNKWKFKHPDVIDFMRIAEDESGLQLDWYKEYWINTTKKIDYKVDSLWEAGGLVNIRLRRVGAMPMPIDLAVTAKSGTVKVYNIPLDLMFGAKKQDIYGTPLLSQQWLWAQPTYTLSITGSLADLKKIEIDATQRMADVDRSNNILELNWPN